MPSYALPCFQQKDNDGTRSGCPRTEGYGRLPRRVHDHGCFYGDDAPMTKTFEITLGVIIGIAAAFLFGIVALMTTDDGPMPPSYWSGDPPCRVSTINHVCQ